MMAQTTMIAIRIREPTRMGFTASNAMQRRCLPTTVEAANSTSTAATSAGTFPAKERPRRREKNLDVRPQGVRSGVPEVEAHHVIEARVAASSHLPESRYPRVSVDQ